MKRNVKSEYSQLRARMIRQGVTIRAWARQKSYPVTTVYGAARGERSGVKASRIRQELTKEFAS